MSNRFSSFFILGIIIVVFLMLILALKNRLIVTLALRNFQRRKLSSLLIILGSMVGAALICGSLIVNDSFTYSTQNYTQNKLGITSGIIYPRSPTTQWTLEEANAIYGKNAEYFDKFLPIYYQRLTVKNPTSNKIKNDVIVSTFDAKLAQYYNRDATLALENPYNLNKREVIISQELSDILKIKQGDKLEINIIENISIELTVKEVQKDNGLIGYNAPLESKLGLSTGSVYFHPSLTECFGPATTDPIKCINSEGTGNDFKYNALLVSTSNSYDRSLLIQLVQKRLNDNFSGLIFEEQQQYLLQNAGGSAGSFNFGQILLIVSSFAIIAGLILIINLFYMIAQERKVELGTLRTLGLSRNGVLSLFVFEGFLYTFLSSFAGVILGIGIGALFIKIITTLINNFYTEFDLKTNITLFINFNSVIYAFCGAWIVTFITTIFSSLRISNLNIVEALQNLAPRKRNVLNNSKLTFALFGILVSGSAVYIALFNKIKNNNMRAYFLYFGFIALSSVVSYLMQHKFNKRLVLSANALIILGMNFLISRVELFRNAWDSGPYLFFINAFVVIISLTILVTYNIDYIVKGLNAILLKFPRLRAVTTIGVKYPVENRFRTSLTISIFSLVVFIVSLVSILRLQVNQVINKVSTDFDIVVLDQLNRSDVKTELDKNKEFIPGFKSIVYLNFGLTYLSDYKYKDLPSYDPNAPLPIKPEDEFKESITTLPPDFFTTTENLKIKSNFTLEQLPAELEKGQYIVLGKNFFLKADDFNLRPDLELGQKIKLKFNKDLIVEREIIGIIEEYSADTTSIQPGLGAIGANGMYISQTDYTNLNKQYNLNLPTVYGIKLTDPDLGVVAGEKVKSILKNKSVSNIIVFTETIKKGTLFLNQLIILIQGFLAFGLVVGLAGVCVVLIRSISDRKQQIGMLKAIGFSQGDVTKVFILEVFIISLLGIAIGFCAGIFSSYGFYKFSLEEQVNTPYIIPYTELLIIFAIILFVSILFSYFPAKKAGKLSPIEATNYVN